MKLLLLLFFLFAFVLVQEFIFSKLWNKNLTMELTFEDHTLREGTGTCLIETITNQKRMALPILHVKLMLPRSFLFPASNNANITDYYYRHDIFSVGRQEQLIRKLHFTCTERGFYKIDGIRYSTKDYFFNSNFVATKEMSDYLCVTPRKVPYRKIPLEIFSLIGSTTSDKALFEDPFEFKGIRQYQPFDNYRSINWKTTARQQDIQVNTFYSTFSCEVFVILNLTPKTLAESTYLIEESISILSTLASHFLHVKIPVGFATNAKDIENKRMISIMPGMGSHHEANIDMKLARIDLNQQCDPIENCLKHATNRQYTQILYIAPSSHGETQRAFTELTRLSEHVIWIKPFLKNPDASDENEDPDRLPSIPSTQLIRWGVGKHE